MLNKMWRIMWLMLFVAFLPSQPSEARLSGPHELLTCGNCHSLGFADGLFDDTPRCTEGCHLSSHDLQTSDASKLFNYSTGANEGTSHAWGVPFGEYSAGSTPPQRIGQSRYAPRQLGCSSCHWPHYYMNNITSQPLLKVDNSGDALCLDCHRYRNVTSASSIQINKQMSHPVGVTIPATTAFNSPPLNPYSSVSGSELKLVGAGSDTVSCSTCHGVHFADSNPWTAATAENLSSVTDGKGVLLRRYNDSQLCKDCHRYQQHGPADSAKWQDCRNCHDPHDPGKNFKLFRFDNFSGPRGWVQVTFDSLTSNFARRIDGKQGVCDACHSLDASGPFTNWSHGHSGRLNYSEAYKSNCLGCHPHAEGDGNLNGSFAAGGAAACGTCHGYPPMANYEGPTNGYAPGYDLSPSFINESTLGRHAKHASTVDGYGARFASSGSYGTGACRACHGRDDDSTHENGVYRNVSASSFRVSTTSSAFAGGAAPMYYVSGPNEYECENIYCHSDGAPNNTITYAASNPEWDTGMTLTCNDCHASTPTTNKHTKHIGGGADYSFGCRNCHVNTVDDNTTISDTGRTTYHVDREKSVFFGATAVSGTYTAATKDCSNTYCHGNLADNQGNNATPTFGAAGTATCGSCHDLAPAGDITTHTKHVATYDFGCAYCHNDLVTAAFDTKSTIDNQALHVNYNEDVKFGNDLQGRTNAAGTYTKATGKCDTIYCHSAGTTTLAANFFVNESTIWNSATVTCASCHGNSVYSGMTSAMPNYPNGQDGKENSHVKHVVNNGIDCMTCHKVTLATNVTIGNYTAHVNANYNVDISTTYGGSYDTGTQTCSGVSCHGAGAPVWGATLSCADCHNGSGDVDDFTYDNNTTARLDQGGWDNVGHGRTSAFPSGNPAANLSCTNCHDGGVAHGDAANPFRLYSSNPDQLCNTCHGPGGVGATKTGVFNHSSSSTNGRYDFTMKCVDCHDPHGDDNAFMLHSTLPRVDDQSYIPSNQYGVPNAGITYRNIDFPSNSAVFLASTSDVRAPIRVCNVCHTRTVDYDGPDPDTLKRYNYDMSGNAGTEWEAHYVGNQCTTSCHKHTNGFEGVSCEGCHGMPPYAGNMLIDNGPYDTSPTGEGAHAKHGSIYISGARCNVCHDGGMDPSGLLNATTNIGFGQGPGTYTTGNYDATGAAHNPTYAGDISNGGTYVCSSVQCHGTGLTNGKGYDTTPVWTDLATGDCGTCHGAKKAAGTPFTNASAYPGSGAHQKHAGFAAGEYDILCKTCHNTTLTTATTLNDAIHVNAETGLTGVDVVSAYDDTGAAFSYDDPSNTCSNTDCHGENSVVWTAGAQTCDTCHNGASDTDNFTYSNLSGVIAKIDSTEYTTTGHGRTTAYPVSGNAGANKGCTDCHTATKDHTTGATYFRLLNTDDPEVLCLSCHGSGGELTGVFGTVTGYQGHTWANLNAAGYSNLTTWHFTPKCIDCHDPHGDGNIFMIHSKVSDEGSSTVAPLGVPTNFPNNSTVSFLTVTDYDDGTGQNLCVVCHDRTLHNGDDGGTHSNGGTDCSSCHDHKLGFTPSGCDGCHGQAGIQDYPPDGPTGWTEDVGSPATIGSHEAHVTALSYTCAECHGDGNGQSTTHGTGKDNAGMKNLTSVHGATWTPNSIGKTSVVDDTCANVDCHSGRAYDRPWIDSSQISTCDTCHGERAANALNNISTGSHYKHTYNGAGYKNYVCTQCHVDNTGNFSHYSTADVDLNFTAPAAATTYSRGTGFATFTTGSEWGTCSNSYCHGATLSAGAQGSDTTPDWGNAATAACGACHKTDNTISQGAHTKHVTTMGLTCGRCHAADTASTHVNGSVEFADGALLNDPTNACDVCHGSGAAQARSDWGSATAQTCDSCHNTTGADVDDFTYLNVTSPSAVVAKINNTDWTTAGHGSVTPAAGCTDCHSSGVAHGVLTNPFRLYTSDTVALCNNCHGTGGELGKWVPATGGKTGIFTHSSTVVQGNQDFEIKCIDCHDPHGDNNIFMVHSTIVQPDAVNNYTPSDQYGVPNDTPVNIDFTNNASGNDYGDSTNGGPYALVCNVCHTRTTVDGGATERYRKVLSNTDGHEPGNKCTTSCHMHTEGFKGGGVSGGGTACDGCHSNIFVPMQDTATHHHYMQNADATNTTKTTFAAGADEESVERRCLMCHVDHNVFNTQKAFGLRQDISKDATASGSEINTDFWPVNPNWDTAAVSGGTGNGICISCHEAEQVKNTAKRYDDGSTKARGFSKFLYYSSSHNFQIISSRNNFSDGTSFRANCSKCHRSDFMSKTSGAQGRDEFGLHQRDTGAVLNYSGVGVGTPSIEQLCYKCHGQDDQADFDYYSSVDMSDSSKLIQTAIQAKSSGHPIDDPSVAASHKTDEYYAAPDTYDGDTPSDPATDGWNRGSTRHVECTDCHNTHGGNSNRVRLVGSSEGNRVAGSQKGTWGVVPSYTGIPDGDSSQPTYTKTAEVGYQHELCLKCHSAYSYYTALPVTPSGTAARSVTFGDWDYAALQTDVGIDFSPRAHGYHPVLAKGRNQPPANANPNWPAKSVIDYIDPFDGQAKFKDVSGFGWTFVPPYDQNSLLACTDCHRADNTNNANGRVDPVSIVSSGNWNFTLADVSAFNDGNVAIPNDGTTAMRFSVQASSSPGTIQYGEAVVYGKSTSGNTNNRKLTVTAYASCDSTCVADTGVNGWQPVLASGNTRYTQQLATAVTWAQMTGGTFWQIEVAKSNGTDPGLMSVDYAGIAAVYQASGDLRGPHGSLQKWILTDLDTGIQFDSDDSGTIGDNAWDTPNDEVPANCCGTSSTYEYAEQINNVFCFNCHRRDVYDATAEDTFVGGATATNPNALYSRISHPLDGPAGYSAQNPFGIWCMNCHGGRVYDVTTPGGESQPFQAVRNNEMHGTFADAQVYDQTDGTVVATLSRPKGVRLLHGAVITGVDVPTSYSGPNSTGQYTGTLTCYTVTASDSLSACNSHGGGRATTVTFNYTYTSW